MGPQVRLPLGRVLDHEVHEGVALSGRKRRRGKKRRRSWKKGPRERRRKEGKEGGGEGETWRYVFMNSQ